MYTFEDYSPTSSTLMNNNNCNVFNIAAAEINYDNNNNNNKNNNTTEILPQPLLSLQSPSLFSPILNPPFDANSNDFIMPQVEEEEVEQPKEKKETKASDTEPLLDLTEYTLQIDYTEILFILQNGETTKLSFDLMEHLCPHLTSQLKDSNVIRNAYLQLIEDGKFNTHSNLTIINKEEKCVKAFPIIYLKNLSTLTMNCFLKAIQLATMIEYNWKFKKLKENDLKIKLNVSSGDLRNLFLLYLTLFNYEWNQCNALDCIIRSVYFVSSSMNQLYFARTTLNNIEFPFEESCNNNCGVVDNSTTNGMSISSTSCAPTTFDMNTQNIINNNCNNNYNYNCIPMWCCINEKQFNERKEKIIKYFDGKINTNFFKNYIGLDIELYHTLQPFNILKEQERLNQSCAWSYFDWSFIHHILTSSDLVVEINKKETHVLAAVGSFIHNNREEILRTYQEAISLQQLVFYNNNNTQNYTQQQSLQNYTQQNNNNIYTTEEVLDSIYFLFSCVKWKLLKDRSQETDLSYFHNYLQILFKTEINIQEMKDKILYFSDQFYSQHYDKTLIERNFKKTNVTNFTMNLSGKIFLKPQINQKQYPSGIEINYNQDELLNEFLNFHKTKEGKELRLNTFKKFILNDFRSFIGNVLPKNYREVIVGYSNGVMKVGGGNGNGNNNQTGGCCGNSNSNNKSVIVNNSKVNKVMKFIPLKTDNNNNNTSEVNGNKQLKKKKKKATTSSKKKDNNNATVDNNANNNNKRKKNEETIVYDTSKRRNSAPDTTVMPSSVINKTNKCILAPPKSTTAATNSAKGSTTNSNGNNNTSNNNNTFCFVFENGMSSTTFSSKSKRRASACNSLLTKTTNKKKGNNSVKKNITKVIEENQEEELKRKCSNNSSFVNVSQPQQLQQVFNNCTNNINHLNNYSMIFSFNNNVYSPENNQAISSINSNINNNQNINNNNNHNDINSQNNNQEPLLFDPSLLNQYEFPNTNNNNVINNSAVNVNNNNSTFDFLASPTYSLFENNNLSNASNNNNNNTSCSSSNNNNEMTILQYDQQFNLLNQQQQNNFDEFLNFSELFNDSISYTTNNNNDNNDNNNYINNNNTNFNNNVASSSSSTTTTTTNNTTTVNANNVTVNNNNNNESGKDPATSVFNYGFGVFIPTYFSIPDLNNNIQVATLGDDELSYL
ncbi:hypothetical protein ABK040_013074 [Willaertia magna]